MDSQLMNGSPSPLMRLRLEASTSYLYTPHTEPSGIAGGDPELALLLQCGVTKHIKSGRGRRQTHELAYRGVAEASYVGTVPRDTPLDEDSVRAVIRRTLRDIRPLRDLDLTDEEWEAILPEDVVPQLAGLARGLHGDGARATAVVQLKVDRHVRFSAPRVLFTACRDRETAAAGGETEKGGGECSICFESFSRGEEEEKGVGVELPGCGHAFHRRCISGWFQKKPTCPLCRGDVTEHLHPELRKHIGDFSHDVFSDDDVDDDDPDIPPLLDAPGDVVVP
ncbi:unnamed protein product [Urochloa decumbens]|uniref:RING-type E3 ubiquitin transferase n=1 Tax=Urochloa decumbens TaxID=240449 RepID=A0ABC9GT82_9POAL